MPRRKTPTKAECLKTLAAAEACVHQGLAQDVLDLLAPLANHKALSAPPIRSRYCCLLAYGYLAAGKHAEAEEALARLPALYYLTADAQYLLARVKHAMREWDQAARVVGEYLQSVEATSPDASGAELFVSDRHRAQMYTWLGESYSELGRDEEALSAFQRGIVLDRSLAPAYLGAVRLLARLNRGEEAGRIVREGLSHCDQKNELEMLRDYLLERPTLSACMIVRNEERLLPDCLESIRDWVDEIVLVDTGSTDHTIEIARQYGARVFEQPWADDFSLHRNFSIEQATGDWIFIIDADERYVPEDIPLVIDAMREGRFAAISVSVYNVYGEDEDRITFANSVRFFRRDLNPHYRGIVHNVLELPSDVPVLRTGARLKHLGYDLTPEQMTAKFQRTRRLLLKQLEDDPDDVFALFNYAELLRGVEPNISSENAGEIVRAAGRVVELVDVDDPERRHLRLMCLNQLAAVYISQKDYSRAEQCCLEALQVRPDYLDAMIHLGLVYYGKDDFEAAILQFEAYLKAQEKFAAAAETTPIILTYPDARDLACNHLGALYELTGRSERAERCYHQALEINPDYRETAARLGRLYLVQGKSGEAERWFRHQLSYRPTLEARTGLATITFQRGDYPEAEALYRQAIEQDGVSSALENDLGNCLYKQGRFDEAEERYLSAVRLAPVEPLAHRNLALARVRQERYQEALADLKHYLEVVPNDSDAYRLAGDLSRQLGDAQSALHYYERALQADPHDIAALLGLSDSYLILGHKDAALIGYRRLSQIEPDSPIIRERLEALAETAERP